MRDGHKRLSGAEFQKKAKLKKMQKQHATEEQEDRKLF